MATSDPVPNTLEHDCGQTAKCRQEHPDILCATHSPSQQTDLNKDTESDTIRPSSAQPDTTQSEPRSPPRSLARSAYRSESHSHYHSRSRSSDPNVVAFEQIDRTWYVDPHPSAEKGSRYNGRTARNWGGPTSDPETVQLDELLRNVLADDGGSVGDCGLGCCAHSGGCCA